MAKLFFKNQQHGSSNIDVSNKNKTEFKVTHGIKNTLIFFWFEINFLIFNLLKQLSSCPCLKLLFTRVERQPKSRPNGAANWLMAAAAGLLF